MTTLAAAALFAADWVDVLIPVVVFLVWLINQIAGAKKAAPPVRPQPRPNAPPNPAGQPAAPQAGGKRGLMDEVEQFLREARKAMEQQQQAAGQRAKPAPPPQPRPAAKSKPPRTKKPQPPATKQVGRLSPTDQPRIQSRLADRQLDEVRLGGSVAQHVQEHLDTSRFDERAGKLSHLRQRVEQDIGSHVQQVFDHQVGSLAPQAAAPAAAGDAPNPAAQIAAMLRDPAGMRNAIILQEILSPPSHRW